MSTNTAIILAAGKGTRLRSVTGDEFPKPLTPLDGKPIIEYSIQALIAHGVNRILIGCGHLIEKFEYLEEKYDEVQIVENPLYDVRASIYTLLIFEKLVPESFYLLEADILYDHKVFSRMEKQSGDKNLIVTSKPLDLDDNVYFSSDDGVLTGLSKQLEGEAEGVMTGIWRLSEGLLSRYAHFCDEINIDYSEDYEIMLARFSAHKEPIEVAHFEDLNWCEIDNEVHLDYALEEVLPEIKE
jgi:2-aminoethylphosphonate-pyruvate transaminase